MSHQGIVLTGFNPFREMTRNPSQAVVEAIKGRHGFDDVVVDVLPTEFAKAEQRVSHLLTHHRPKTWIGIGLSQRATAIIVERRAQNLDNAPIADNAGEIRLDRPIDPDGPDHYPATVPVEAIFDAITRIGVPVEFCDPLRHFVCNHVFYTACRLADRLSLPIECGFIHIPWPAEWGTTDAGPAILSIESMIEAVVAAVEICRAENNKSI